MSACGCSEEKKQSGVSVMFQGQTSDDALCQALHDAEIFVQCYGETYEHDFYDVLVRYYACHLLHSWGFATTVTAGSAGVVSASNQVAQYGDKEGADPYITEFRKLLGGDNEIVVAI